MTDPIRKLAKKQFAAVYSLLNFDHAPPTLVLEYRKSCIEVFERILREHHEGLAEEIEAAIWDSGSEPTIDVIRRVLEGGEQAAGGPDGDARTGHADASDSQVPEELLPGSDTSPAAPDQPHEFVPKLLSMTPVGRRATCDRTDCCRPADDPIHQTNEVSDERRSSSPVRDVQEQGLGGPTAERPIPGVSEVLEHHGSNWEGASGDQPQVTNYDAESEARARKGGWMMCAGGEKPSDVVEELPREGVWVGPGDEVEQGAAVGCVIGTSVDNPNSICVQWRGFKQPQWDHYSNLTSAGQPVLGFRERESWEVLTRHHHDLCSMQEEIDKRDRRIAELERELNNRCEHCGGKVTSWPNGCPGCSAPDCCQSCCDIENLKHERDEALRELDLAIKNSHVIAEQRDNAIRLCDEARAELDLIQSAEYNDGLVCLDDATIERVFHEINQGAGTLYDDVIRVLRSLRDGKLKEASDDDA